MVAVKLQKMTKTPEGAIYTERLRVKMRGSGQSTVILNTFPGANSSHFVSVLVENESETRSGPSHIIPSRNSKTTKRWSHIFMVLGACGLGLDRYGMKWNQIKCGGF